MGEECLALVDIWIDLYNWMDGGMMDGSFLRIWDLISVIGF